MYITITIFQWLDGVYILYMFDRNYIDIHIYIYILYIYVNIIIIVVIIIDSKMDFKNIESSDHLFKNRSTEPVN